MPQACLFETASELLLDDKTGRLQLIPRALAPEHAEFYFRQLRCQIDWRQDEIRIAGRQVLIPRLQAWYGDCDAHYGYSGLSLTPKSWSPALLELKQIVEELSPVSFNSVLLNLYRDGRDSMGWHSDDEPELGCEPVIASLSLGASRYFSMRRKSPAGETLKIQLEPGSLLIMSGRLQQNWQHGVPKTRLAVGERINLTFRLIQKI